MKALKPFLMTALTVMLLMPVQVFGCACCAERGDYFHRESELADFEISELEKIELGSAILHTDAGYPDSIVGVKPLGESFTIKAGLRGKSWQFSFTDDKARTALLVLARPQMAQVFGVDQDPLSESSTVVLYKEMRFDFRVESGTGFLKEGIDSSTRYKLILQGRGNMCMNASDFSTYILQVHGNKANYSFFGKLSIAEDKVLQMVSDDRGIKVAN